MAGKKRAGNLHRKATRAASWARNQLAKVQRKEEQAKREAHNRQVGPTGTQRGHALRKEAKAGNIRVIKTSVEE